MLDLWQTPGTATGYDRFGRAGQMKYTQGATALVDLAYGYDAGSNRVYREDMAASAQGQGLDELYGHDDLSRMNNFQVGTLNANKDAIASGDLAFEQDWGLDQLGNWATFNEDIDGDGDGDDDLVQDRAANTANEITDIGIAPDGIGADWINPVYDAAGNMTQIPQADTPTDHYVATYDAWNRLVKLEDPGSGTVVATYEYNGVNHRVRKTVDPNGAVDIYDTYYNTGWQALEVRKDSSDNPYEQFVYDGSYIDAPFMRYVDADTDGILDEDTDGEQYYLRDASFNVVALLDEAGAALERYLYTPYGQRVVLDADFTNDADNTTGYGQQRGFQGLRHDEESGLIENRRRMLDPTTGRFVQRDPVGYPDGMNAYAAYHVMYGGVDPSGLIFKWYWNAVDDAFGDTHQQNDAQRRRKERERYEERLREMGQIRSALRELTRLKAGALAAGCDCLADEIDEALRNFTEDFLNNGKLNELADVLVGTVNGADDVIGRSQKTFDRTTFIGDLLHGLENGGLEGVSGDEQVEFFGEILGTAGDTIGVMGDISNVTESLSRRDGMDLALTISITLAERIGKHAPGGGPISAGIIPMLQFYLEGYLAAVNGIRNLQINDGTLARLRAAGDHLDDGSSGCGRAEAAWDTVSNIFGVR